MTIVDTGLLMEVLREIRADVAEIKRDQHRLELRQTVVEGHLSSIIVTLQAIREEMDETRADVRRIKQRLDLVEQP